MNRIKMTFKKRIKTCRRSVFSGMVKGFLMVLAVLGIITATTISTKAYTEDSNGNLVSDNLYNIGVYNDTRLGVSAYVDNQTLTLNGTSTSGSWNNVADLSITLNPGTYTMQWFTNYVDNNIGFGLRSSGIGLTELYQLNTQRYKTFTISETTTFTSVIWWQSGSMTFDNVKVSCMVYEGNYKAYTTFEPYGAIYYSQDNYSNALLNDYGIFRLCSSIQLKLSWTNSTQVDIYEWDSILSLLNDKSYVKCQNGVFSYNNSSLSMDLLGGSSNATAMWQFNFEGTYPQIKQYPSMIASGYDLRYQIIDERNALFAYDDITNDNIVDLMEYQYKQIGYFQLYTGSVAIAVNFTSLYFETNYNVAYTRGYENGKTKGYDEGYENGKNDGYENGKNDGYDLGYNQGVEDGEASDFATNGFKTLIGSIFNYPINMIRNVFNFEFMGINIAALVTFIISIVLVIFIVHKFKK